MTHCVLLTQQEAYLSMLKLDVKRRALFLHRNVALILQQKLRFTTFRVVKFFRKPFIPRDSGVVLKEEYHLVDVLIADDRRSRLRLPE